MYFFAILLVFHIYMFHQPECLQVTSDTQKRYASRVAVCRFVKKSSVCALLLCTCRIISPQINCMIWNQIPGKGRLAGADDHGDQQGKHGYVTQRGWKVRRV